MSAINDSGHVEYLCSGLCLDVEEEDDEEEEEGEIVYLGDHDVSMCHEYSVRQKYIKFYDSDDESVEEFEDNHEDDDESIKSNDCDAESTENDDEEIFEENLSLGVVGQ